jgi:hypothetical protein
MSTAYGNRAPTKRFVSGGLETIPEGAHLIPTQTKMEYDSVPFHVYHPSPHDAITILKSKKNPHEWLVCGWYIDTLREGGAVKGLVYRSVVAQSDRDAVLLELKKHDKEATAKFEP